MFKQSDSDSHGVDSWVNWDSWIGWDEMEDSWRTGRPDESKDKRKKELKGGSTEESGSGSEEHIPGKRPRSQRAREKLGMVVLNGLLTVVIELCVANWQQTNLYMRGLATRFLSARFRVMVLRLGIS